MALNVLIVEDEIDLRLMTRIILEAEPSLTVLEAETGTEALEILANEKVDVVLLDSRLPDMDGWDILKVLGAHGRFPDLPVVMVSAHSTPSTAERALKEGVKAYVTKPFTREELLDAIQVATQGVQ